MNDRLPLRQTSDHQHATMIRQALGFIAAWMCVLLLGLLMQVEASGPLRLEQHLLVAVLAAAGIVGLVLGIGLWCADSGEDLDALTAEDEIVDN